MKRENWIDALKGISAFGIIMVHTCTIFFGTVLDRIRFIGMHFVTLFFLLSVYLMFRSVNVYFESHDYILKNCLSWILNKMLNLAPIFYIVVLLGALTGGREYWLGHAGRVTIGNVVAHLLGIFDLIPHYCNSIIGNEWYLGVYIIFVCMMPVLYKAIDKIEKAVFFAVIITYLSYFILELLRTQIPTADSYIYTSYLDTFCFIVHLPTLGMGILLYFILEKTNWLISFRGNKLMSYSLLVISAVMLVGEMYTRNSLLGMSNVTLYSIWFACMILSQSIYECKLICNVFFRELGKKAYVIYLIQWFIIDAYDKWVGIVVDSVGTYLLEFMVVLVTTYVAAVLLERYVNMPCKNFLKRYIGAQKDD